MPVTVFVLWWIGLGATLLFFVPLSVALLHRTFTSARLINRYAAESLTAAAGIAGNTKYIPALDDTIAVGSAMVGVGGQIAAKLDTAATVLAQRAE
ncbi:MAG: hypothetical protein H0T54_03340 [Geodermatophilaceae bacterium]|nr:hypothetical protein [Geodermatophilaceae bacterium]